MTEEINDTEPKVDEAVVWTETMLRDILRGILDPELHINIIDLGLVYGVECKDGTIQVKMTLTSPGCPYGPYLLQQVKDILLTLKGVKDVQIEVVWDPPWGPDKMSEEARLELGFDI